MPLATTSTSSSSLRGSHRSICSMLNGPERSCTTAAVIFIRVRLKLNGGASALRYARDCLGEIFRRLCARNRELAAEDKAWHAFNACFFGGNRFLLDLGDILVSGEGFADVLSVQTNIGGSLHQHGVVGQVGALGEIEIHQPLFHLGRLADASRPADQPMRVERVGLPADL